MESLVICARPVKELQVASKPKGSAFNTMKETNTNNKKKKRQPTTDHFVAPPLEIILFLARVMGRDDTDAPTASDGFSFTATMEFLITCRCKTTIFTLPPDADQQFLIPQSRAEHNGQRSLW